MYKDIVELVETGAKGAQNHMLHGYALLEIVGETRSARHPLIEGAPMSGGFYVKRTTTYIVGRTEGTPYYNPFSKLTETMENVQKEKAPDQSPADAHQGARD